jgi:predicted RNA-binding protein with RPS1 domain
MLPCLCFHQSADRIEVLLLGLAELLDAAEDADAKPRGRGARKKKDVSVWADADPNDYIPGTVRSVMTYGAFVTLSDGNDGLLHVSQMSDKFTENAADIVSVGDEVQVRVIKVDMEKNQVALSMKDPQARRPRQGGGRGGDKAKNAEILKKLAETADEKVFVPGTVVSVQDFGAFVKLEEGVEGLVHISQLKDGYLASVSDAVAVGDEVQVRIDSVDLRKGQLKLSMLEWKEKSEESSRGDRRPSGDADFMADPATTEELSALAVGYDDEMPSWFEVALSREEEKKAKKAAGEKYLMAP